MPWNRSKGLSPRMWRPSKRAHCAKVLTLCSGCGLGLKKLWPETYRKTTGQGGPFFRLWTSRNFSAVSREPGMG